MPLISRTDARNAILNEKEFVDMTEKCCTRIKPVPVRTPDRHVPSKLAAQRHSEEVRINKSVFVSQTWLVSTQRLITVCAKNVMLRLFGMYESRQFLGR